LLSAQIKTEEKTSLEQ